MIRPQEIGCLAELGKHEVSVFSRPKVAVLATGDELVSIERVPGPGQIRNSNEVMIAGQLSRQGAIVVKLGIARDDTHSLAEKITEGLSCDMLLLSGGVSAGARDLVPAVLESLRVRRIFHKVRMKPGQPVWFGVGEARHNAEAISGEVADGQSAVSARQGCYVFGLPGNPVSSMVCCELFARTALRRLMGVEHAEPTACQARLTRDHFCSGNRPTFHLAWLEHMGAASDVSPVSWVGSADLCATANANSLVHFPEADRLYTAGTILDVYPW